MTFAFEKLLVYQKSVDFADAVCDLTEQFPARYNHLADQVNRASLSIASNIAEVNGRFTKPDRKHFFGIARGSVQEFVLGLGGIELNSPRFVQPQRVSLVSCQTRSDGG